MSDFTLPTAQAATAEPYDLTALVAKSAELLRVEQERYGEIHRLMQHLAPLFNASGLLAKRRDGNLSIKLPGNYTFTIRSSWVSWLSDAYVLYQGPRSVHLVVYTQTHSDGTLIYSFNPELMGSLMEDLEHGLLDEINTFLGLPKEDRALFLLQRQNIHCDTAEEELDDTDTEDP